MMLPALPEFIQKEKVRFRVLLIVDIRDQACRNAGWIKENAIGILQNGKFQFLQFVPDMFRKTTAHQQQFVFIVDGCR